jgi:hypothetical protein
VEATETAPRNLTDDRATSAQGHITFVDIHVLLHHELADGVNWLEVVERPSVRVVIPLRVIEELDAKKYTHSARIRAKAQGLMPKLRALIGPEGMPTPLRDVRRLAARPEVEGYGRAAKPGGGIPVSGGGITVRNWP